MKKNVNRNEIRYRKKARIRKKVFGTPERPRLVVFRSNRHISAQIIDDINNQVLVHAISCSKANKDKLASKSKTEMSVEVGKQIAELAKKQKIETVVFDRNGYIYHGRVKALAEASREAGLKF
ncbi:MAG: large subunit ribosomal protein [Candidatus Marinimicrobia bacterium]|jgi:large subunit ribosomal protein L18|nr:large subunit ribosomal protein [Candidatus Neomarinimicrobiota bacterium]